MKFFLRFFDTVCECNLILKKRYHKCLPIESRTLFVLLLLSFYSIANSQTTYTTAGTYSYIVPAGVTSVTIYTIGAGGGSGGCLTNLSHQAAGGGGGGASTQNTFTVTPGQTLTVIVGAGGTAGTALGTSGGTGGTSSVTGTGVSITAVGGGGGGGVIASGGAGTAGAGGSTGTGYSVLYAGGAGTLGVRNGTRAVGGAGGGGAGSGGAGGNGTAGSTGGGGTNSTGGTGGSGAYGGGTGAGASATTGSLAGVVGNAPGGGAAGAANSTTSVAGALGGNGEVVILNGCTTPSVPTSLSLTPSISSVAGSFTAPSTAPTGYLVIRTTSSTPPTTPVTGTTYTAGTSALGGYVVSIAATTGFTDNSVSPSTQYWYWVYSYNNTACVGPVYSATSLNNNTTTLSVCSGSSAYVLDNQGYVYSVNTSTAALQTPLNNTVGVAPGTSSSNALGYSAGSSLFYYFSKVSTTGGSTFISYDGASTYTTLSAPFAAGSNTYSVLGTSTADGAGFYVLDNNALLWYYKISTNTWTKVVTSKIVDGSGNNLSTQFSALGSGDLVEDGYGTLWLIPSGGTTYGIYYIAAPPTTATATVTAVQVLKYNTALPAALQTAGEHWGGAAFDNTGNLFLASLNYLYEMPIGTTTLNLVGGFTGLKSGSTAFDMAQCTYTSNPLPIKFAYFNANLIDKKVDLKWWVAQASNVKGFYVERSNDSRNWDKFGYVPFANGVLNYLLTDANPAPGINYYRINETDLDGNNNYSEIRTVELPITENISVWPNPAVDIVNVLYNGSSNNLTAIIVDELGRIVSRPSIYQGNNIIALGKLPSGIYFLQITGNNKELITKKIIKRPK